MTYRNSSPLLVVNFEPVPAALKFFAERTDVFAVCIKHKNCWVVRLILVPLVNHIQVTGLIECHIVRRLPGELVWQLRPIVSHFVLVLTFAENDWGSSFFGGDYRRQPSDARGTGSAPAAMCRNSRRWIEDDIARLPGTNRGSQTASEGHRI